MRCRASIFVLLLAGALAAAVPPSASSNDLVVARRALGDGLWQIAEKRALAAEVVPNLREAARLVQLEALSRAGQDAEVLVRLDSWGAQEGEAFRYWRARALVCTGKFDLARQALDSPFSEKELALLADRLRTRLEVQTGGRAAIDAAFLRVSARLADNPSGRAENAVEWARALESLGDSVAAREVLAKEKALDVAGAAGDAARLLAADLMARAGDAAGAHKLRQGLVDAGDATAAGAFVPAAVALADEFWLSGNTNAALTVASNAVRRANNPELERLAGFTLGFKELAVSVLHTNGVARISSLLNAYPDAPEAGTILLRYADELLRVNEPARALREYDRLLNAYPQFALDVRVFERRGWAFHALSRHVEAVGAFARAAQVATNATDRARCTFKQADELMAGGRFAEAAAVYARVDAPALREHAAFLRADALAREGKSDESVQEFRLLLDGGGAFAVKAGLRLAAAETVVGRTENAITVYNRLLGVREMLLTADEETTGTAAEQQKKSKIPQFSLTPSERIDTLYGRGRAFYRVYRFDEAEKDFSAVAELQPARMGEMRFLKALCRYGAGRDDEAHAAALDLLKDTPDSSLRADLVLWLAKFDYARRDYSTARTGFEAYAANVHAQPVRRLEALMYAARCAAAQVDHARAVELVSRAVTNSVAVAAISQATAATSTVAEAFLVQGESLMELARFDEAVLVLERVGRMPITDDVRRRAAVLKADCLFAMGADNSRRYHEALDAYRAILQNDDASASVRLAVSFKIGRTLEKLRRFEEAADQYYTNVVMAYCDGVREKTWFDSNARAFFARAAFILADWYETAGRDAQAAHVLDYLVVTGVPAAEEARKRIARLKRKGGLR